MKARLMYVEQVREAIRAAIPADQPYRPADMGDVDYTTRYHGIEGDEVLPSKFKFNRYLAMASFMHPASPMSPYLLVRGDIVYFKRTELGKSYCMYIYLHY